MMNEHDPQLNWRPRRNAKRASKPALRSPVTSPSAHLTGERTPGTGWFKRNGADL